ncbi:hypothetical protein RRG08_042412 [Elysia crispata]|uniref:Uncharacterized protein n=1 Tax=Elysia crispata TaxID=231223 RepID=A0AAE1DEM2_9GAST|nr:hypothetical protein RRG08_042412 [Elysia crispata]
MENLSDGSGPQVTIDSFLIRCWEWKKCQSLSRLYMGRNYDCSMVEDTMAAGLLPIAITVANEIVPFKVL